MDGPSKALVARAEWHADRVFAHIALHGRTHSLWFAASGEDLGREEDFLLPLALFPAMVTASRLELHGKVSARLLSAVPKIQDIFSSWSAEYWGGKLQNVRHISVDAEVRAAPAGRPSGVACFFSGGVDSFYTLLKHRDEITHIIFVHGFDIALEDRALRAQASRMAREVAKELGKVLIEVETNIRSFSDAVLGWEKYHGAAMASVALLFQHRFQKILIASSHSYTRMFPWGSHVLLDPLWSTEITEIEHDGCEAQRLDKAAYVSEHDLAMEWLRVCFENPGSAYNCGHCGKCLVARVALRTVGALERCKTLPGDLDLEEVANMDLINNESRRGVVRQILTFLEHRGTEPELARALSDALDKSSWTGDVGVEPTDSHRLQQQLFLTQKKLERSHFKLEASRTRSKELHMKLAQTRADLGASRRIAERLRAKSNRLAKHNHYLTARFSGRRYRLADAFMSIVLRIPGIGNLIR